MLLIVMKKIKKIFFKNPYSNLFKYFWKYSKGNRHMVVVFLIFSLISYGVTLIEPLIIARIFNNVQFNSDNPEFLELIVYNILILFLLTVIFWIFHGTSRILENKNAFFVRKNYKQEMFEKVVHLPSKWHRDHHSGDTIDKINKASDRLFYFSESVFMFVNEGLVNLLGSFIIIIIYYKIAGLITVVSTVLIFLIIILLDRILNRRYFQIFKKENYIAAAIHDYVSNIFTVITLRIKKRALYEVKRRLMLPYKLFMKNVYLNEFKWFGVSILIQLMISVIIISNAYHQFNTKGVIAIGILFALFQYLEKISRTFFNFAWQYTEMVERNSALVSAEVINKEYAKTEKIKRKPLRKNWEKIEIKDLFFRYEQDGQDKKQVDFSKTLKNISLDLKRGQKVAFVGESGSGKTTLMVLLRGLYNANKAKVFCDGEKLEDGIKSLWDETSLIPQEPEIFQNTILYNITLGINTKKEQVEKFIDLACFRKVLGRLPKDLKTNVAEKGVSLSGGEKQRLALARGLLAAKSSSILLLDEPTSSVDTFNEIKIFKNIFSHFKDKTIIASVHRLHLLKSFDYIYYFKQGRIAAQGSFDQIYKNSVFQKVWSKYNEKKRQ
ncbi:MAG: ATP-binding cassette domain-containing protein [Candidatus Moranbacteria bacterium]|nr:ATP-binding cassette domain-containing protein [Candidatus Moranbacteria bacterium]